MKNSEAQGQESCAPRQIMPIFAKGVPRWPVLVVALGAFLLVPPERFAQGPDFCLWRHLFCVAACHACGSTRALAAFFHGHFAAALALNRNVVVTAPGLLALTAQDLVYLLRRRRVAGRAGSQGLSGVTLGARNRLGPPGGQTRRPTVKEVDT